MGSRYGGYLNFVVGWMVLRSRLFILEFFFVSKFVSVSI